MVENKVSLIIMLRAACSGADGNYLSGSTPSNKFFPPSTADPRIAGMF